MLFRPQRHLTFANFASRPGSIDARAEGIRLATRRHSSTVPLLLLAGREGTGKTHLLHAIVNLAQEYGSIRSSLVLSSFRFAEEVHKGIEFGDLCLLIARFAREDLLAIDDADQLFCRPEAAHTLLKILRARALGKKRSVLTLTLSASMKSDSPLSEFLDSQLAVRLS
jgi:chromosomal replication initiation ATPase DnaA